MSKTFEESVLVSNTNNISGLSLSSSFSTLGGLTITLDTAIGGSVKLYANGNFTALKAPTTASGTTLYLPDALPVSSGSFLICDTSGNLTFSTATSGGAGIFTTITASGQITSTLADGTPPFVVTSTTNVPNLNASSINGNTFDNPGAIGGTTASSATFTNVSVTDTTNSTLTSNGSIHTLGGIGVAKAITVGSNFSDITNPTKGNFITVFPATFTDSSTSASGTLSDWSSVYIGRSTVSAVNTSVTTTVASSLFIDGSPIQGTNETISNVYSLNVNSGLSLFADQIISTLSTGTAPFVINSTTNVSNLNASLLNGNTFSSPGAIGNTTAGSGSFTTITSSSQITSTLSTGTAPLVINSTTNVPNLNASLLNGNTFSSPGAIGNTTAGSGNFTTISASSQITSTLSTGTAPFVINSTTNVPNLNASSINGNTFASPGPIGGTTANTGTFTNLFSNSLTLNGTSSGAITIQPQASTGTYNFNLPTNSGSAGQVLISAGGGGSSMTWATIITATQSTSVFSGANNQTSPVDITGLSYTSGFFDIDVTVDVIATTNLTQFFKLSGVLSGGTTLWNLSTIGTAGDDTSVIITITSSGQLQYKSGNYPGFVSLTFTWVVYTPGSGAVNVVSGTNTTGSANLGNFFTVNNSTFSDNATASSGTLALFAGSYIGAPTLAATNTSVTTTTAATFYIANAPITGTNETITDKYAMYVAAGNSFFGGAISNSNPLAIAQLSGSNVTGTGSDKIIIWNNITTDTNGFLSSGVYTPTISGVYMVSGWGICTGATFVLSLYKNGTTLRFAQVQTPGGQVSNVSGIVMLNGTTDSVNMSFTCSGSDTFSGSNQNYFSVIKIR